MKDDQENDTDLSEALVIEGLLLEDDELLIYQDEKGNYHILSKKPYDKEKEYRIIKMSWKDFPSEETTKK